MKRVEGGGGYGAGDEGTQARAAAGVLYMRGAAAACRVAAGVMPALRCVVLRGRYRARGVGRSAARRQEEAYQANKGSDFVSRVEGNGRARGKVRSRKATGDVKKDPKRAMIKARHEPVFGELRSQALVK